MTSTTPNHLSDESISFEVISRTNCKCAYLHCLLLWCYMIVLAECSPINIVLLDVIHNIKKSGFMIPCKVSIFFVNFFCDRYDFSVKNAWRFLTVHGGINFRLHWSPSPWFRWPPFCDEWPLVRTYHRVGRHKLAMASAREETHGDQTALHPV